MAVLKCGTGSKAVNLASSDFLDQFLDSLPKSSASPIVMADDPFRVDEPGKPLSARAGAGRHIGQPVGLPASKNLVLSHGDEADVLVSVCMKVRKR